MPIGVLPGRWRIKETDICQLSPPLTSLLVNRAHAGALGFSTPSSWTESVDSSHSESFTLLEDSFPSSRLCYFYWFINNRSRPFNHQQPSFLTNAKPGPAEAACLQENLEVHGWMLNKYLFILNSWRKTARQPCKHTHTQRNYIMSELLLRLSMETLCKVFC